MSQDLRGFLKQVEELALVALRDGARVAPRELVEYCRQRLAAFKYPRHVTVVAALPRSGTGKVQESQLRAP